MAPLTTNSKNGRSASPGGHPRLLTLDEAAEELRISVDTLLREANYGHIATVRIGRRRLVAPADLDAFIGRQREEHQRDGR